MHIFIPYFDAARIEQALQDAGRITRSGDRVTVMAPVIVPAALPLDVEAGEIWKRVCQAERRTFHAREVARRLLPTGVSLRCLRVQARDQTSAILTGLADAHADCLLLAMPSGMRGAFAMRFGAIPAVIRHAPCNVRFVGAALPSSVVAPATTETLATLQVIAVNPVLAQAGRESGMRRSEGQPAS